MNITINITALLAIVSSFTILTNAHILTERSDVLDVLRRIEGDPDLEAYLREAIENFREQMTLGIPAINMPVLDPLKLKNLDINLNEDIATLNLQIQEMGIMGLANFTVSDLQADLDELYLNLTLDIPFLSAEGQYNLSSMIYKIFPIYGNGLFRLNATSIVVSGAGQLRSLKKDLLQMTTLELDLEWYDMKMDLGHFLGGGSFQRVLEKVIPVVGRDLFLAFKPTILHHLNDAAMRKINEELMNPKIRDLISGILHHEEEEGVI